MATADGSTNDPTINGSEPFNGNGNDVGGNFDGDATPDRNEHGAVIPESIVIKRGRGRPRKDGTSGPAGNDTSQASKNGGEKTGQARGANLDVEIFATQLQGFHAIIAKLTKNELWNISADEAKKLAKAIKEVMALHKITIPSKYMVYGQLFAVGAAIYGPRMAIMAMQQNAEKKARQAAAANTFNPDGSPVMP